MKVYAFVIGSSDDFDDIQCEDFYGDDYEAVETDS